MDEQTSVRLGGVRQQDTGAEILVRRMLYGMGLRFRVRNRDLPGSPDVANRRARWVVFVHGCFWHRHAGCSRTTTPKRNRAFWLAKFQANKKRDRRVQAQLRQTGFRVVVVWECELRVARKLERRLSRALLAAL